MGVTQIIAYPTYDVTSAPPVVQSAYGSYRQAVGIITTSNRDLYQQCLDWLAKGEPQEYITSLTWMTARQGVDQALGLIVPAINMLESEWPSNRGKGLRQCTTRKRVTRLSAPAA